MCRVICVIIVIILPSWLALKRNVLHGGTHITRFLVLLLLIFALCLLFYQPENVCLLSGSLAILTAFYTKPLEQVHATYRTDSDI